MSQPPHPHEPSIGHSFTIAVVHLDLHLPVCHSLKEKRGRLARIMNHLRKKHPVVVSEVGEHNVWGRAALAAVTLSTDRDLANRILEAVADTIDRDGEVDLVRHEIELL